MTEKLILAPETIQLNKIVNALIEISELPDSAIKKGEGCVCIVFKKVSDGIINTKAIRSNGVEIETIKKLMRDLYDKL